MKNAFVVQNVAKLCEGHGLFLGSRHASMEAAGKRKSEEAGWYVPHDFSTVKTCRKTQIFTKILFGTKISGDVTVAYVHAKYRKDPCWLLRHLGSLEMSTARILWGSQPSAYARRRVRSAGF
jgi:hypothetical protein